MAQKEQFAVLAEAKTVRRLDALRIVMGVSRTRVGNEAWERGGIRALEREHAERLVRLATLAEKAGLSLDDYVQRYAQLNHRKTYGPTLEELEHLAE